MMLLHQGGWRMVDTARFAGKVGVAVSQTMVNGERQASLFNMPGKKPAGLLYIDQQTLSRLHLYYGTPTESQEMDSFRAGAGCNVVSGKFYAQVDQLEDGVYVFGTKLTTGANGKLKIAGPDDDVIGVTQSQPTVYPGGTPVDVLFDI